MTPEEAWATAGRKVSLGRGAVAVGRFVPLRAVVAASFQFLALRSLALNCKSVCSLPAAPGRLFFMPPRESFAPDERSLGAPRLNV